ncbi:MAG: 5-(carboxyamino)imidazole ribonucleotide synthase [Burkholderiales bacterium]
MTAGMILPGATLGVLGGGQLGRMFTMAALTMGYRVLVLDPDPDSPAGQIATEHLRADYRDAAALERMGRECAAVTTEFENVHADSLRLLARHTVVRPSGDAVAIVQDRAREKTFLAEAGFPTAPFGLVPNAQALPEAAARTGFPALLKVSRFGYDGKGQARVESLDEARAAFAAMGNEPCVLEAFLPLAAELSVVLGRDAAGRTACYPVAENRHRNGILDISMAPARVSPAVAEQARAMAVAIAEKLDYCGVLAVEFFLLEGDRLVVNEIAPRPHNSGHYTLDACLTSQFQQQVRVLCGLPLGDTRLFSPVVMVNLLGDVWRDGPPDWSALLAHPDLKLHLYGKRQARPGRKMGHFNVVAPTLEAALATALAARAAIGVEGPPPNVREPAA